MYGNDRQGTMAGVRFAYCASATTMNRRRILTINDWRQQLPGGYP
jgi:hypothetical protein